MKELVNDGSNLDSFNSDNKMSFYLSIETCMKKYATFKGRAKRSEYWWFYLFTVLLSWGAQIVGYTSSIPIMVDVLPSIISLIFLLPTLAVSSRRLHDIGKSGWWTLLLLTIVGIFVLIIWWATDTNSKGDKYNLNE